MAPPVQRFGVNATGRDFVAGDIHGCFDQLEAALDRVRFDSERDRLFSVGDLVDRGPQSAQALGWLAQPWFHACLGNHEAARLMLSGSDDLAAWLLYNGGEWWFETNKPRQHEFLTAFAQMPYAMEIETAHGRVGIVHADVPAALSWPKFVEALVAGDALALETAVWGRQRATGLVTTPVSGIDRVVCGHTAALDDRPRVVGNVWIIDAAAFVQPQGRLILLALEELFAASTGD